MTSSLVVIDFFRARLEGSRASLNDSGFSRPIMLIDVRVDLQVWCGDSWQRARLDINVRIDVRIYSSRDSSSAPCPYIRQSSSRSSVYNRGGDDSSALCPYPRWSSSRSNVRVWSYGSVTCLVKGAIIGILPS